MNNQTTRVADDGERRWRVTPAAVMLVSFVALLIVIAVGVVASMRSSASGPQEVTVADLKGDPDRYDGREVTLSGWAESVRELPVLSQFALYTFRDDTDSITVLSQKGAPPGEGERIRLTGTYHSRTKLDKALRDLAEEQLGPLAGTVVDFALPGVPLNVAFIEHERFSVLSAE
jgi:hypothetical protein